MQTWSAAQAGAHAGPASLASPTGTSPFCVSFALSFLTSALV
jgi:hypothetical protein